MSRVFEDIDETIDDMLADVLTPEHDLTPEGERLLSILHARLKPRLESLVEKAATKATISVVLSLFERFPFLHGLPTAHGPTPRITYPEDIRQALEQMGFEVPKDKNDRSR